MKKTKNWILGKAKYDIFGILFPGVLGLFLVPFILDKSSISYMIIGLLALSTADAGHVYSTFWLLFKEKKIQKNILTYLIPAGLFITVFCWYYFQIPYLWSAVVYGTFFHYIRQFYGVSRWYQFLNKKFQPVSDFFLYVLMVLPLIMLHFAPGLKFEFFSSEDIIFYPSLKISFYLMILYLCMLSAWVIWEIRNYFWLGVKDLNRFFSVFAPILLYLVAMAGAQEYFEAIFIPILLAHGMPYITLVGWRLRKKKKLKFKKYSTIFIVVFLVAFLSGGTETMLVDSFVEISYRYLTGEPSLFWAAIVALYLTPILSHYLWDMYIWKREYMK